MISNLPQLLLIEMPGGGELLLILVVVLLLFGGKKIPELMRGLGRGMREFNDAKGKITSELEEGLKEKDVTPSRPVSNTSEPVTSTTESGYDTRNDYPPHTEYTPHPDYTPHTETTHTETTLPNQTNGKL